MPDPVWKNYLDAQCTQEIAGRFDILHYTDGSEGSVDFVFYRAEVTSDVGDNQIHLSQVKSNPGVTNYTVTPTAVAGAEHAVTEIKLATSAAGLSNATAGAALSLGTTLQSGQGGKKEIHARVTNSYQVRSTLIDLRLAFPETIITDVEIAA